MRQSLRSFNKPTEGERARALAYVVVGISSAGLGLIAVLHLDRTALFDMLSWSQRWMIVASGLGGLIALFLSGDRMGQGGAKGAVLGVAGGIWVTFVGALIGGTLVLPIYGTMFGPFIVGVTLAGAPLIALLWVFNLISVHVLMGVYQRERDSIFTRPLTKMMPPPQGDSLSLRLRGRLT